MARTGFVSTAKTEASMRRFSAPEHQNALLRRRVAASAERPFAGDPHRRKEDVGDFTSVLPGRSEPTRAAEMRVPATPQMPRARLERVEPPERRRAEASYPFPHRLARTITLSAISTPLNPLQAPDD